ncbi:MAG: SPASM domain-containing protein [bacterium]|nr:SPASM domain-containing protein [bacterium]
MKKFKKIYIEITNICNLSCSFCRSDNRKKEMITLDNMEHLLKKINNYTDHLYLHVKGEPLLHPNLKEILDLCQKYQKKVNITTNGTLLKEKQEILTHSAIRQINISLHSENQKEEYLESIFKTIDKLVEKIVVYRFWTLENNQLDEKSTTMVNKIVSYYQLSPEFVEKMKTTNHIAIKEKLYIDKKEKFIWPDIKNKYKNEVGTCYALKDQLAILVDGTVVPCCLDSDGIIKLGNIYTQTLAEIANSEHYQKMKQNFANYKIVEELCKHCHFKERLVKNKKEPK